MTPPSPANRSLRTIDVFPFGRRDMVIDDIVSTELSAHPCIEGARITVRTIMIYVLLHGQTPEDLLTHYPHISLASIYDARSYYYDNREAIDRKIAEHLSVPEIGSLS